MVPSQQFFTRALSKSNVRVNSVEILREPAYSLTGAQLNAMTIEQLKNNKIQRILYGGNSSLGRLTFLFPNNVRSPPVFSYGEEPDKYSIALGNAQISTFGFGISAHATEPIFFLSNVAVLDENREVL